MLDAPSLAQWLERLETLHPNEMELGLERVAAVAHRLRLLPVAVPVISIAGTNGKGSTAAVLEAVLGEVGSNVGVCSSPHFMSFNERIRVGGTNVDDDAIIRAFEQIDEARDEISLTYFEFATLAALLVFRERKVDVVILEVGLGGRLDAVNIVDASVAVISSIDLDHQEWLGETRELIAYEKAGIFRRGQAAVIAEPDPPESLRTFARETGVQALYLGEDFRLQERGALWSATLASGDGPRTLPEMPVGSVLPANICAALQVIELLGECFSDQQLLSALAKLKLPGRRERCELTGRNYLLDVAHNLAAINKLLEYIDVTDCNGRNIALFSVMGDKDIEGMLEACSGRFDAWFLADQPDNSRAARASDLADVLYSKGNQMVSISKNIRQAFRRAQSLMTEGDRLVIFGSFFTVAAVMPLLEKDRRKEAQ
jgi:dihydrofolate synthase/folylpolyglutamate synthase